MRGGGPGGALGLGSLSLGGRRMRGAAGGGLSAYAVNGNDPATVADFAGVLNSGTPYFRVGGSTSSFASMFSFSRASAATYTNSSGNLVSATSGTARTDHYRWNGSSYVRKGILLESAAATNLQTYSGNFSTQWDAENATVTNNQRTGPDGATSMAAVAETTANNIHGISDKTVWSATSGVSYTTSAYVAPRGATQYVQITYGSPRFGLSQYATFDLINGTVSGASIGTGHIELVASGIYRIGFTAAATNTGTAEAFIISSNAATGRAPSFAGNTANGFFVYGVQTEAGSVPTSYIPTSGATATRAAETLTIAGSNMAYSATAMSFQMQGDINYADDGVARAFYSWVTSSNDNIRVYLQTAGSPDNFLLIENDDGGVTSTISSAGNTFTPGVAEAYNFAHYVNASDINAAVDGTALTASGAGGSPDISTATFAFGTNGSIANYAGNIALFRQWDVDIGDSGIESAST